MAAMSNDNSGLLTDKRNPAPDVSRWQEDCRYKSASPEQPLLDDSDDELLGIHQSLLDEPPTSETENHDYPKRVLSTSTGWAGKPVGESELVCGTIDNQSVAMNGTRLELVNNSDLSQQHKMRIGIGNNFRGGAESRRRYDERSGGMNENGEINHQDLNSNQAVMKRPIHCHSGPPVSPDMLARNQMITVVILCVSFMIGETVGGVLSNSLALFTDVVHLGSDLISFIISLLAIYLSTKPASQKMSFGYHRAEVLGALFSVFLIWLVSGILCYIAVERIVHEHYKNVKPNEMLITACLGVCFNVVMGIVLHSERCCGKTNSRKSFGHGHSHSHSSRKKNKVDKHGGEYKRLTAETDFDLDSPPSSEEHRHKNINVRAAFIHVLGDIIQSIGVLVAALIIKLKPEDKYRLADPICTFLFSVLVLITTVTVLRDALRVLLEGVPKDIDYPHIRNALMSLDGVKSVHSLHVWSLTIDRNSMTVHLAVDDGVPSDVVLEEALLLLKKDYDLYHTTIQVEKYNADVMLTCPECQDTKP